MMRQWLAILFLAALTVPAWADLSKENYLRDNRILEEEIRLAGKPQVYFVFDLREKTAYIKARGISLRELRIKDFSRRGGPMAAAAYSLKEKKTFFKPGRETIKPRESKDNDNYKIEALELSDMPSRFTLVFDGGLRISIRPETEGVISGISNLFHSALRLLTRPLAMLWHAVRGKPYCAVDIVLNKNDARTIFWSFSEGSAAVVYHP